MNNTAVDISNKPESVKVLDGSSANTDTINHKQENIFSVDREIGNVTGVFARRNLQLCLAIVALLMASKFALGLSIFESARESLQAFSSFGLFVLGCIAFICLQAELIPSIVAQIRKRFLPVELAESAALILAAVPVMIDLFSEDTSLASFDAFLVLLLIVALDRKVGISFKRDLRRTASVKRKLFEHKVLKVVSSAVGKDNEEVVTTQEVDPENIAVGDLVKFEEGDTIPLDVVIKSGSCQCREHRNGCWNDLRLCDVADGISAGSKVTSGSIICQVVHRVDESLFYNFVNKFENKRQELSGWISHAAYVTLFFFAFAVFTLAFMYLSEKTIPETCNALAAVLLVMLVARTSMLQSVFRKMIKSKAFLQGIQIKSFLAFEKLPKLKNIFLDYTSEIGTPQVVDLQLVDTRIDENMLAGVLFSFFARGGDVYSSAVVDFLSKKYNSCKVFQITDHYIDEDQGTCGMIEGSDFTIGKESFLVQRGVFIQLSDVDGSKYPDSEMLYVAIGCEVIAKIEFAPRLLEDGVRLKEALSKYKLNIEIVGNDIPKSVEERTGLKVVSSVPSGQDAIGYFGPDGDVTKMRCEAVIQAFPDLHKETMDFAFFGRDLLLINNLLKLSRSWNFVKRVNKVFPTTAAVVLLVCAVAGITTPVTSAMASFFCGSFMCLLWARC